MEPDLVEIAPPPVASPSRTRKPRKAVIPEVIDVEHYEFRNSFGVHNGNNLVDKKNKGKAIQVSSFSYNGSNPPPGSLPLDLEMYQSYEAMEVADYSHFQDLNSITMPTDAEVVAHCGSNSNRSNGSANSSRSSLATPYVPQSWDFFSGSALPLNNQTMYTSASVVQPQPSDLVMVPTPPSKDDASASSSRLIAAETSAHETSNVRKIKEEFLQNFKRFDIVENYSDHHYASKGNSSKQHSKKWWKKVQEDLKILENDLPETIFVRACELRMDLLRAVIIGAEGTPYHDGLFFFDIQFPDAYPSVPPNVYYHSGGLRINPNLYNCGKVCLSLLGTWSGKARERWIPTVSTMLQLLVSIQALILNQKPYFNEPGYERSMKTKSGEVKSKAYSENVFILSLKTMVYSMRRPPKHFEEFVRSHFYVRALDIVKACSAYKDGAPVGSMIKGGIQDIEETDQTGSKKFKSDVSSFVKTVVEEFVKLGVKELEDKPEPPPEINQANPKRSRLSRKIPKKWEEVEEKSLKEKDKRAGKKSEKKGGLFCRWFQCLSF